jgi:chemotaxis protein CheZ
MAEDINVLKRELVGLFGHMQRIRKELAALSPPGAENHFGSMSEQLDAIVAATESATNTIMEVGEGIDEAMNQARALSSDPELGKIFESVTEMVNRLFEACSFQDITGQRVSKVVHSAKFVEERINAVIVTWGKDELNKVVVEIKEDEDEYKKFLHGPQLPGKGVDQAEVDKLLAQSEIDKLFG